MTLSSVFAAARVLRHEAMRDSHQQPHGRKLAGAGDTDLTGAPLRAGAPCF